MGPGSSFLLTGPRAPAGSLAGTECHCAGRSCDPFPSLRGQGAQGSVLSLPGNRKPRSSLCDSGIEGRLGVCVVFSVVGEGGWDDCH